MNFEQTPDFQKDLKRLAKKWRSLPQDVKAAQRDLVPLYIAQEGIDIKRLRETFFNGKRATILRAVNGCEVVKMRLDVADMNTNNKVRLVFVAVAADNKIIFVELYAKNDKDREDGERISRTLNALQPIGKQSESRMSGPKG